MSRVLAIDYGEKRTGLAVTDTLKMIASALTTVETTTLWEFLSTYLTKEDVDTVVLGLPLRVNSELSAIEPKIQ